MPETVSPFANYALRLCELLQAPHGEARVDGLVAALNGEASQLLRDAVSATARRDAGCFFTSGELAERLLRNVDVGDWSAVADPACGAGDLLLAAARRLPLKRGVRSTLEAWGRVLIGRELDDELVRTARARLALLASARLGRRATLGERDLAHLLPNVRTGDGRTLDFDGRVLMLLNPPFGSTVTSSTGWGSGRVGRAALFTASTVEALPPGSRLLAILPDVLRSGSNYRHWRDHIRRLVTIQTVEPYGQFDPWTDVDVFLLQAVVGSASSSARGWQPRASDGAVLGDLVEVRVGTVVPHRDPNRGAWSPYIEAHDLPLGGRFDADDARRRRHRSRRFHPPFVAVRRTSRPGQAQPRALGVLVVGTRPVLVENHLLVCRPVDDSGISCDDLLDVLSDPTTSEWLDARIRCRHLTVRALSDLPLPRSSSELPNA